MRRLAPPCWAVWLEATAISLACGAVLAAIAAGFGAALIA